MSPLMIWGVLMVMSREVTEPACWFSWRSVMAPLMMAGESTASHSRLSVATISALAWEATSMRIAVMKDRRMDGFMVGSGVAFYAQESCRGWGWAFHGGVRDAPERLV